MLNKFLNLRLRNQKNSKNQKGNLQFRLSNKILLYETIMQHSTNSIEFNIYF